MRSAAPQAIKPARILLVHPGGSRREGKWRMHMPFPDDAPLDDYIGVNTGDTLVGASIDRAIRYSDVRTVQFRQPLAPLLDAWGQPDIAILRGSNYINQSFHAEGIVEQLKLLKCPIVPIGFGAQAPTFQSLELPASLVGFLHFIRDHCETLGVRGAYTAEVLNDIGVTNVQIIGCPSFYRMLQPEIKVKDRPTSEKLRIGANFNSYLGGIYCSDIVNMKLLQAQLLEQVVDAEGSHIYWQGESTELYGHRHPDNTGPLESVLEQRYLVDRSLCPAFLERLRVFIDVDLWSNHIREHCDVMIGFRLHGCVMALSDGTPAIMFTYDSRTREVANLFRLPTIEIEDFPEPDIASAFEASDFGPFERAYRRNYAEYYSFLNRNAIPHSLPEPLEHESDSHAGALRYKATNVGWLQSERRKKYAELQRAKAVQEEKKLAAFRLGQWVSSRWRRAFSEHP